MDKMHRIFAVIGKWPKGWRNVYEPVRELMVAFRHEMAGHNTDNIPDTYDGEDGKRSAGDTTHIPHGRAAQSLPHLCPCYNVGLSMPQGGKVYLLCLPCLIFYKFDVQFTDWAENTFRVRR